MIPSVFHVVLYQPEIPPNTGNVIRLCANVGATLHLVHPLGFELDEPRVRRAGLDYHELACVREHADFAACRAALGSARMFAVTTRATRSLYAERFAAGDAFVFGPETAGLPAEVLAAFAPDLRLRLPMQPGNRSLNLSNAAAVTVFEAWRQLGFPGGA
jgi:tRNA (cytidine/uridine-2'-O-)-methyltransferase